MRRPVDSGPDDSHALWLYVPDAARAVIRRVQMQPSGALLTIVDDRPTSSGGVSARLRAESGLSSTGTRAALRASGRSRRPNKQR